MNPLVVPQVNVNDDDVVVAEWTAAHGARVSAGEPVCMVQTSKAAVEITAEHGGVLVHVAAAGDRVAVGGVLGFVGETLEIVEAAAEAAKAERSHRARPERPRGVRATERAVALAREHGIDLATAVIPGVSGSIKASDVQRFIDAGIVPEAIKGFLESAGTVSAHEAAMIGSLVHSRDHLILATLDYQLALGRINAALDALQRHGCMAWFQHVVIAALGRTLPEFPRLASVRVGSQILHYASCDIGFVVRAADGRLFTPVVRNAGALSVAEVAAACGAAGMRVVRSSLGDHEMSGGCFTISHVSDPGVTRFNAIPNRYQSAILAIAGEQSGPKGPVVTLTVTYDHGLCDGTYVAQFVKTLDRRAHEVIA
jgi:pyruvate/2-oxoglutarate dehydrogenase complex dihydrolipoamide acyltransferase (E2) component